MVAGAATPRGRAKSPGAAEGVVVAMVAAGDHYGFTLYATRPHT